MPLRCSLIVIPWLAPQHCCCRHRRHCRRRPPLSLSLTGASNTIGAIKILHGSLSNKATKEFKISRGLKPKTGGWWDCRIDRTAAAITTRGARSTDSSRLEKERPPDHLARLEPPPPPSDKDKRTRR
ncbi:hypothetical protein NL676_001435 [Syzygium grande]|nr:hypothetical protein NL676_001435 [Syzygium grande]